MSENFCAENEQEKKDDTQKKSAGRHEMEPTDAERARVQNCAGLGLTHRQIAALIRDGISDNTLRKHFALELQRGVALTSEKIGAAILEKAVSGDAGMMSLWARTKMEWHDTSKHEVTGKDGGAIQIEGVTRKIIDSGKPDAVRD